MKIDREDKRVMDLNEKLKMVLAKDDYYGLQAFFKGLIGEKGLMASFRDIQDNSDTWYFSSDEYLKVGTIYKGELSNFQRHGFGVLMSENGDFYIGQSENNKAQGLGFFMHR